MSRRLPPLNALRAFEAAARCGSFTRAAQELFVTQGAISRHVAALEDWVKVQLFARGRHGVELTSAGRSYFAIVRTALDQIEHGTRQLQQHPDDRRLRLKLPPTFAIRWLMPRLARFHAKHPDIDVQITTSHQRANFEREDVDISIHSDAQAPRGNGHRRLFRETLLPVCAPGLLAQGPPLKTAADLAHHVLLSSMNRPNDWPAWLARAGVPHIDGNNGLKFENAALAYQAAMDQLGVIVALLPFVRDDLASGRLVAPIDFAVPTEGGYYLTWRDESSKPSNDFLQWIVGEAVAGEGVESGDPHAG